MSYQRTCTAVLIVTVTLTVFGWWLADRAYSTGAQHLGYAMGVLSVALPALALSACVFWLRGRRERGDPAARVVWLIPLLKLSMAFFAVMFLFSLM